MTIDIQKPFTSMVANAQQAILTSSSIFKNPVTSQLSDLKLLTDSMTTAVGSMGGLDTTAEQSLEFESVISHLSNVGTMVTDTMTQQISSIQNDVSIVTAAREIQNHSALLDSAVTGSSNAADSKAAVDDAFRSRSACSSDLSSAFAAAFAPITQAVKMMAGGIKDMLSSISASLGKTFNSVREFTLHLISSGASAVRSIMNSIKSSATAVFGTLQGMIGESISGLKARMASVTDGVMGKFNQLVAGAKSAIAQVTQFIKGFSLVNLLNHADPCVQQMLKAVVNTNNVSAPALLAAKGLLQTNIPVSEAIATVSSGKLLPPDGEASSTKMIITPDVANYSKYTKDELDAFNEKLFAQDDLWKQTQKTLTNKLTLLNQSKIDLKFEQKKLKMGTGESQSTDPQVIRDFQFVKDQLEPQRLEYNDIANNQANPQRQQLIAMNSEYQYRLVYGRTPYSNSQASGKTVPVEHQTVLLDSGI